MAFTYICFAQIAVALVSKSWAQFGFRERFNSTLGNRQATPKFTREARRVRSPKIGPTFSHHANSIPHEQRRVPAPFAGMQGNSIMSRFPGILTQEITSFKIWGMSSLLSNYFSVLWVSCPGTSPCTHFYFQPQSSKDQLAWCYLYNIHDSCCPFSL